ncbi:MAG TPA: di-heme-cytochrome C peroxidase [Azospirillaceae bacterium]|nr:di-heme-cytochrome C peroxidase [Azospirillaceae bacterium]
MRFTRLLIALPAMLLPLAAAQADGSKTHAVSATPTVLDQNWTAADRDAFYWTSQGSRIMRWDWFKALERPDSQEKFLADDLARFHYLPDHASASNPAGLPVGFTLDKGATNTFVGMTCAACHTNQIEYKGASIRIDGAPANSDFQGFLEELVASLEKTAYDPDKFDRFAREVLGKKYGPQRKAALQQQFQAFTTEFATFMKASLPARHWGPARLDAFGMIFNRLTGLDLNVPKNVVPANAPVSYPFLWNAHQQDAVQWNLSAPGGDNIKALARNTGEVIGVFAKLNICRAGKNAHGERCSDKPLKNLASSLLQDIAFYDSSASIAGLQKLEDKIAKLTPPDWPTKVFGPVNVAQAEKGRVLFEEACAACHNMSQANLSQKVWKVTPAVKINTDPVAYQNALRTVKTGILEGTRTITLGRMKAEEPAVTVLSNAVIGTMLDGLIYPKGGRPDLGDLFKGDAKAAEKALVAKLEGKSNVVADKVGNAFAAVDTTSDDLPAYEARPLMGIWATAPYLHNGSVRNLWELLKPSARPATFKVAPHSFDPKTVGIATDPAHGWVFDTSLPGNSNKGHDTYDKRADGTPMTDADLWAIVEYMKTL